MLKPTLVAVALGGASLVMAGLLPWHWPRAWVAETLEQASASSPRRVDAGATPSLLRHGRASLVLLPQPRLTVHDVEWRDPRVGLGVTAPEVTLELRLLPLILAGRASAETITLENVVITVDTATSAANGAGSPNLPPSLPRWRKLQVRDGIVTVRRGADVIASAHNVNARLDVPRGGAGATLQAQAVWRGAPISIDASDLNVARLASTGTTPLSLMAGGAGIDASFDGTLDLSPRASFQGKATLTVADLQTLPLIWRPEPPVRGRLSLRAMTSLHPGRAEFTELRGSVGATSAEGALRIEWWENGAEPPRGDISGTLAFASLDARDLAERVLPHLGLGSDAAPPPANERTLPPWDIDLRWSSAALIWGPHAIQRAAGHVTTGNGRLDLVLNEGDWHGAAVKSRLSMAEVSDGFDLRGSATLDWPDVGRWATAIGLGNTVSAGQGQAHATFASRGATTTALQDTIEGRIVLGLRAGALVDPVSRDIGSRIAGSPKPSRRNGSFPFDRLSAVGRLERGVLGVSATADSAGARVTLEGPVDVARGALRLRGSAETGGDATRSLGFAVSGPLSAPRTVFDEPGAAPPPR